MDRRRLLLVALAAVFLVGAVIFSRCSDDAIEEAKPGAPKKAVEREKVVFPRDQAKRRRPRQLTHLDTARPDAGAGQRAPPPKDALQRAVGGEGGALFVEVNAIRHSELVGKMMRCRQDEAADQLSLMKEELGIDPSEDLDRVGFDDGVFAASGFFQDLKIPDELGAGEAYGDSGKVYELPPETEGGEPAYAARVGDDLVLMGDSEEQVKAAIDRVEGRAEAPAALPEPMTRSEIYGTLDQSLIRSLLQGADDPVARRVAELVTGGTVRMNVDQAVSLSLDLESPDQQTGEDLAKAVGGALAMLRRDAVQRGDEELAWLLEQARVMPGEGGKFDVDLAVPGDFILSAMGCDAEGNRKPQ